MASATDRTSATLAVLLVLAMVGFAVAGDRSKDKAWSKMTDQVSDWLGIESDEKKSKDD